MWNYSQGLPLVFYRSYGIWPNCHWGPSRWVWRVLPWYSPYASHILFTFVIYKYFYQCVTCTFGLVPPLVCSVGLASFFPWWWLSQHCFWILFHPWYFTGDSCLLSCSTLGVWGDLIFHLHFVVVWILLFSPLEVSQDADAFWVAPIFLVRLCFVSGVRYLLRFHFMVCIVLGFLTHDSCIHFSILAWVHWVPHLVLPSDMVDLFIVPLTFSWRGSMLSYMFMHFTFPVGFRWLSWCSLTRPPSIAIVPLPRPGFPSGLPFSSHLLPNLLPNLLPRDSGGDPEEMNLDIYQIKAYFKYVKLL